MGETKDGNDGVTRAGIAGAVNFGLALVVAASPTTRVVMARIAERAGLRVHCEPPETAQPVIAGKLPAIALLSGGADGHDCDHLLEQLSRLRQPASHTSVPLIVLLTVGNTRHPYSDMVDMVIAKPVTPDRLQPAIHDLMDRLRA